MSDDTDDDTIKQLMPQHEASMELNFRNWVLFRWFLREIEKNYTRARKAVL